MMSIGKYIMVKLDGKNSFYITEEQFDWLEKELFYEEELY